MIIQARNDCMHVEVRGLTELFKWEQWERRDWYEMEQKRTVAELVGDSMGTAAIYRGTEQGVTGLLGGKKIEGIPIVAQQ